MNTTFSLVESGSFDVRLQRAAEPSSIIRVKRSYHDGETIPWRPSSIRRSQVLATEPVWPGADVHHPQNFFLRRDSILVYR
jgi:hypothetical protein